MEDYISMMQRNENMCMSYILKAEQERQRNNGLPSKAECVYLQEAAKIRAEMARISVGAEKQHQENQKKELDARIRRLVLELSPDFFKKNNDKPADAKDGGSKPQAQGTGASSVSDETVKSWFDDDTTHGFDAVAGMKETVEHLRACISETKHADLRSYLKMSNTHGFLLFGPPGCGKTYIATAFAHELRQKDYKFMRLVGADILSKYVGEAEGIVKRMFEEAQKNAPCIMFIDEIDSLCKNRSLRSLPEYASSITTAFLNGYNTIVDRSGENAKKTIIFIGATNYPNLVDDAMIDRVELVRISLPDKDARAAAYAHKLNGIIKLEDGFTVDDMAEETEKYNRRDIDRLTEAINTQIVNELSELDDEEAIRQIQSGEYRLTRELFEQAKKKCIPSPKDNILREQEEWEKRLLAARDE